MWKTGDRKGRFLETSGEEIDFIDCSLALMSYLFHHESEEGKKVKRML